VAIKRICNLDNVDADNTVTFTVNVTTSVNGNDIEIDGAEMTSTFDDIQDQIDSIELATGLTAELVDYELISVSNTSAQINVSVLIGSATPVGGGAATAWPAGNTDICLAATILQDSINRSLDAYNLLHFGTGTWYTNVNVITGWPNKPAGPSNHSGSGFPFNDYNCTDCLFYTLHPYAVSYKLPNNKFTYFHNKGIDLVNKIRVANAPLVANSATISCEYGCTFLPCTGCTDALMIVNKVYVGGNAIAY